MSAEDTDDQLQELLDSFPDRPSKYEFMKSTPSDVRIRLARLLAGLGTQVPMSPSPETQGWRSLGQYSFGCSGTLEPPGSSQGSLSPYNDTPSDGVNRNYAQLCSPFTPPEISSSECSFVETSAQEVQSQQHSQESLADLLDDNATQFDGPVERDPPKKSANDLEQIEEQDENPDEDTPDNHEKSLSNSTLDDEGEVEETSTGRKSRRKTAYKNPEKGTLMWRMGFLLGSQHADYVARRREARIICNKMDFTIAWTYNKKTIRDLEIDKLLEEFQEYGYNRVICEDLIMDICQKGANVAKRAEQKTWQSQNPGQKQKPGRKPKSEPSTPVTGKVYPMSRRV